MSLAFSWSSWKKKKLLKRMKQLFSNLKSRKYNEAWGAFRKYTLCKFQGNGGSGKKISRLIYRAGLNRFRYFLDIPSIPSAWSISEIARTVRTPLVVAEWDNKSEKTFLKLEIASSSCFPFAASLWSQRRKAPKQQICCLSNQLMPYINTAIAT